MRSADKFMTGESLRSQQSSFDDAIGASMLPDYCRCLIPLLTMIAGFGARPLAADDNEETEPEKQHPFAVRIVDPGGQPVAGALGGVTAHFGAESDALPLVDESGWRYSDGAKSNADGI